MFRFQSGKLQMENMFHNASRKTDHIIDRDNHYVTHLVKREFVAHRRRRRGIAGRLQKSETSRSSRIVSFLVCSTLLWACQSTTRQCACQNALLVRIISRVPQYTFLSWREYQSFNLTWCGFLFRIIKILA